MSDSQELAALRAARHGNPGKGGEANRAHGRDAEDMNHYREMVYLDEWLRVGQAAVEASVHPDTIRAWVDSGLVHAVRYPNGERRIRRSDLLALIEPR